MAFVSAFQVVEGSPRAVNIFMQPQPIEPFSTVHRAVTFCPLRRSPKSHLEVLPLRPEAFIQHQHEPPRYHSIGLPDRGRWLF